MNLGTSLNEQWTYNRRLQPEKIQVGSLMTLDFGYGAQNKNNGNVQSQAITRQGALLASLTYGYDTVNRLTGATGPTGWSQGYNYDQYGNRTISPAQQTAETPTGFQSNNRVSGWHYDFAGNVVGIPVAGATTQRASCVGAILPAVPVTGMLRTSCYDGEGHMVSETDSTGKTSTYEYDGQGRRVRKTVGTVTTTYAYDAAGQLAAEYGGEVPADSGTRYLFTDHLGSTRLTAKGDGTDPKPLDYYPFGEEVNTAANAPRVYPSGTAATELDAKFTGKLRDAESGLDFFEARYYSSVQGRFTSPDEWAGGIVDAFTGGQVGTPGPLPYADISDPQTINKYAYVKNNPMRYVDPDGHQRQAIPLLEELSVSASPWIARGLAAFGLGATAGQLTNVPAQPQCATCRTSDDYRRFFESHPEILASSDAGQSSSGSGAAPKNTMGGGELGQPDGPKKGSSGGPGAGKKATDKQRKEALAENDGKCVFCGKPVNEAEHSIPRSRDGNNTTGPNGNLQPACTSCNRGPGGKHTKTSEEYLREKGMERQFR